MKQNVVNKTSIQINRIIAILIFFLILSLILIITISNISGTHSIFINNAGRIRGGIQKTAVTALTGHGISENISAIDELIGDLDTFIGDYSALFSNMESSKLDRLKNEWAALQILLEQKNPDHQAVFKQSNLIWALSDEIVSDIENKSHSYIKFLYIASIVIITVIITLILLIIIIRVVIQNRIETQAAHDKLTGLYNRNYLTDLIKKKITEIKNTDNSLAFLMCDIDHFKMVNDKFGHETGDEVLKHIAKILSGSVRSADVLFRSGGEEFLIITDFDKIQNLLFFGERLRKNIENSSCNGLRITISIGISIYRSHTEIKEIINEADTALYKAKSSGRNRVVLFSN